MNLQATVESLWAHDVVVLGSSSVYETEPVGEVLDQRPFYNACLRIETALGPERLLDACKAVERAFGRAQAGEDGYVRHGPRAIDVDVLLLGDLSYSSDRLTLPHREVTTRRFVLVPLLELAPDLEVPGRGRAADALELIDGQDVRRAGPPLEVGP
jgi:2-amino-4-hydroxy-6-hydroxymethyldihydropteridine diphosphokinase